MLLIIFIVTILHFALLFVSLFVYQNIIKVLLAQQEAQVLLQQGAARNLKRRSSWPWSTLTKGRQRWLSWWWTRSTLSKWSKFIYCYRSLWKHSQILIQPILSLRFNHPAQHLPSITCRYQLRSWSHQLLSYHIANLGLSVTHSRHIQLIKDSVIDTFSIFFFHIWIRNHIPIFFDPKVLLTRFPIFDCFFVSLQNLLGPIGYTFGMK